MYCRFCGKTIPDDSDFCPFCGKALNSINTPSNQTNHAGDNTFPKKVPSISKKRKIIIYITISCVIILAIIVGGKSYANYAHHVAELDDHSLSLFVGQQHFFNVQSTLISSDNSIVEVNGTTIIAKTSGTATITSSFSFAEDYCSIEVIEESIKIQNLPGLALEKGEDALLQISTNCADSNPKITWSTSDTSIATVNESGKVSGLNPGTVTITASLPNGISDSYVVSIIPSEINQANGFIKRPSGYEEAPVTVHAPQTDSCYVYFQSQTNSKNDFSIFVNMGTTTEVEAPVGTYIVYVASGKKWYGTEYKFGSSTYYYKAEDTFRFYSQGNYVYGTELTLYKVQNGNLETETINESQFPD